MKKHFPLLFVVLLLICLMSTMLAAPAYADGSVSINKTNFPDETFRQYVKETWDKDGDNVLSADEITAAQSINLSENDTWKNGIASLDGIQYFTNLRYLVADAMPNISGALDFSNNRELRSIKMSNIVFVNGQGQNVGGKLSSVTLGNLPKLRELNLTNQYVIKSIDVSQCPAIENLSLGGTSISTLDVSKNKNLAFLACNHTFLSELNVSNNTQLFGLNVFSIKVPFTLTLGNQENLRALAAQYSHMDNLDISGCPILLGLLKEEYYTDQGDYHSYETAPGNDGSRIFYDKHVLLQTEKNQVFTTLTLPAALTRIEEDAFAGTVADTVVLPENCVSVRSGAFANCPKLQIVYASAAAVFDEHAFDGCGHVFISRTE